jgi:hypothetical protein
MYEQQYNLVLWPRHDTLSYQLFFFFPNSFFYFLGCSVLNVQQYGRIPTVHQGHDRRISIAKRTMHRENSKLQTTASPTGVTPCPPFPRMQKPETIRQPFVDTMSPLLWIHQLDHATDRCSIELTIDLHQLPAVW